MHYLYKITDNLNNKVYIGQSNKETERWRQHKYLARQDEPIQYIQRAIKKYGVENFTYEVIAMCLTQEDADWTETELIKQYDSQNKEFGYNIAPGGDHSWNAGLPSEQQPMYGKHHTEESRKKISESNIGKEMPPHTDEWKQNMSKIMVGRISPMLGKKQSDFFKQTMSKINTGNTYCLGKKLSDETKSKISIGNLGKTLSEETKIKLSIAHTGKKMSKEAREKMSIAQAGKSKGPMSDKTKRKISSANLGKIKSPLSQETKDKISLSNTGHKVSNETRSKIGTANSIKFLPEQIANIQKGELTLEKLAKMYGVGISTIWRIKRKS